MLCTVLALGGCAYPSGRVLLPLTPLKTDTERFGYQTETDRHWILTLPTSEPAPNPNRPHLVEHWLDPAYCPVWPLRCGWTRHALTMTGPYPFESNVWFPFGNLPKPGTKGGACGLQQYRGIKTEGGKDKEWQGNTWPFVPLEFHPAGCIVNGRDDCGPSEQHAFRWRCDGLAGSWNEYDFAAY